ncbi:cadherin-like beta sandwich domain-containing protein [Paenibacillus alba]|uniref:Cadherin-like beta sandwich domain-containing protein n=1 Tax=Paenibacillus alba TaxID=1197127 RepID=A0ABU6FY86_9BACL|nr:cadherin-like beta sandwich domain-containing protein [Paenibacillus alba]MEC0226681.1 cadherin-like beta sandwich domain-containing protein [Paenibacillus alba]
MRIAKWLFFSLTIIVVMIVFPWNAQANDDSNADLRSIYQEAGALSPDFSPSVTEYTVRMSSSVSGYYMAAIPLNPGTKMEYSMNSESSWVSISDNVSTGFLPTNRGNNTFQIKVTSKDLTTTKTYKIHVYYPEENDASLADLYFNEKGTTISLNIQANKYTYSASVPYATSSISLTGVLTDPAASFTINGSAASTGMPSGQIPLNLGANEIMVKTKSSKLTVEMTYKINVTRQLNTEARLSSLEVSPGSFEQSFSSDNLNYTMADVANATSALRVTPTLLETATGASVRINVNNGEYMPLSNGEGTDIPLQVGSNLIKVEVTAEEASIKKTYTITVNRKSNTEARLKSLEVSPGSFEQPFSSDNLNYTMANLDNATSALRVTPTLLETATGASVRINVNNDEFKHLSSGEGIDIPLQVGVNLIKVEVTAEEASIKKTYTITVNRKSNTEAGLSSLTVSPGSLEQPFSSDNLNYTMADLDNATSALRVTPTLLETAAGASVRINVNNDEFRQLSSGEGIDIPLQVGVNLIKVEVKAQEASNIKEYKITVVRKPSSELDLLQITMIGVQATLNFSEPLLQSVTDVTYYTVYNTTTQTPLTVTGIVYSTGSSQVILSFSQLPRPTDKLEFKILADAVTSVGGKSNVAATKSIDYGTPLEQMEYRLHLLDTDGNGIHINEIVVYLNGPYGKNDLTGDGKFNQDDVKILLNLIAPMFNHGL